MPKYLTPDWTSHHTAAWRKWLAPLIGRADAQILEIGCLEGRSAVWMLENILTGKGAAITTVDPWAGERFYDWPMERLAVNAAANLAPYVERFRCRLIRERSYDYLPTLPPESFDAAYIDGDHSALGCLSDLVLTWPLLRSGGVVFLDDYLWGDEDWGAPRTAIEAFRRCLPPGCRHEISRAGLGQFAIWKPRQQSQGELT